MVLPAQHILRAGPLSRTFMTRLYLLSPIAIKRIFMTKPITTRSSRIAWHSPWYRIRQDEIVYPDGREGVYNVVEISDTAWVVPLLPAGEVVLIRNYRHTLGQWCWELPAGGIRHGQTPRMAAEAELLEEAGGTSAHWQFLLRASTMNGIGHHYGHFFIAHDVVLQPPRHEATEFIEVHPMPWQEALTLARSGAMNDAVSMLALLLAEPHRNR